MTAPDRSRLPHPCDTCPCPAYGLECKDVPGASTAAAEPDEVRRALPVDPGETYHDYEEFSIVGGWGVDGADSREGAVRFARKALAQYPGCGAQVRRRIVRTWDDTDAQFFGPWEDIDLDGEPA